METSDTGDTAQYVECEQPNISAAKLAGETGGISCTTSFINFNLLILLTSFIIVITRRI